jgi:biopolymer transport protein ExbB
MATVPTMSGMIAALSGVLGSTLIKRKVDTEILLFDDHLTFDH